MSLRAAHLSMYVLVVLVPLGTVLVLVSDLAPALRAHASLVIGVYGLFVVASTWVFVVHDRKIRRASAEIERAAHAIGRGELRHRVPLYASDELSRAGRALNEMAERLEHTVEEASAAARFDLLRRCRTELSREVASVTTAAHHLAELVDAHAASPVLMHGAAGALRRLTERLASVERALAAPDAANGRCHGLALPEPCVPVPVALSRLVEAGVREAGVADAPGVRLRVSVPAGGESLALPVAPLRTALADCLRNALTAMPGGGLLKVDARVAGGRVTITVIDTGAGMSRRFVDRRLFHPFASDWPDGRGFGLSLYRDRTRLRALGGDVDVTSRPGVGTRVSFWVPIGGGVAGGRTASIDSPPDTRAVSVLNGSG